jgi:hypothetical protein
MSDADKLTEELLNAGASREQIIEIINSYGDSIDWGSDSIHDIIGEVWNSDINSGNNTEDYIINTICRIYNLSEVK